MNVYAGVTVYTPVAPTVPFAWICSENVTFGVGEAVLLIDVVKIAELFAAIVCVTVVEKALESVTLSGVSVVATVTATGASEFEMKLNRSTSVALQMFAVIVRPLTRLPKAL